MVTSTKTATRTATTTKAVKAPAEPWSEERIRRRSIELSEASGYHATTLRTLVAGEGGMWTFEAVSRSHPGNAPYLVVYDEARDALTCECASGASKRYGEQGGPCAHKGAAQLAVQNIRRSREERSVEGERQYHAFAQHLETRGY